MNTEVQRRRTFAIIAHPDAGKTTLTEKLLLFGGAIQLAGAVKAKKDRVQTRSDWMQIERERGISVVTSVMTFEYSNCVCNLLDTPGHADFADDTYRTLTAVDSVVMVLDAAKGIEPRTLKLFEVCRMREIPIITFVNKMDREARDPFAILDEIEEKLALDTAPVTWPIGLGRIFSGTFKLHGLQRKDNKDESRLFSSLEKVAKLLPHYEYKAFMESVELAQNACKCFSIEAFQKGYMTPVFFGSALYNYGVQDLINTLVEFGPCPHYRTADTRIVYADEQKMTGFVFRIQANMDPNHRDRIAFLRICSGQFFFARSRQIADEAFAGDIVGITNHGALRIGDTVTEGEELFFKDIPNFSPDILRRVQLRDAMQAKKLKEALRQMAEEGVVQLFMPDDGSQAIIGVVGALQIDVLRERLKTEYSLAVLFETAHFTVCRWISTDIPAELEHFIATHHADIARDLDNDPVFLTQSKFSLYYEAERWPLIHFATSKDCQMRR